MRVGHHLLGRDGSLGAAEVSTALARMRELAKIWDEVQPTERLRRVAERLLRVHQLRAADALQLAAMVEVADEEPRELDVVCFDERLARAALREGFRLIQAGGD
jgi:predicted nucleic acid-binding protein